MNLQEINEYPEAENMYFRETSSLININFELAGMAECKEEKDEEKKEDEEDEERIDWGNSQEASCCVWLSNEHIPGDIYECGLFANVGGDHDRAWNEATRV